MSIGSMIARTIAPLRRKIRGMVARGAVEIVNDSLKCQGLQITLLEDEVLDDVERFQEYGSTSVPFSGADVLSLSVGGNRSHSVVACVSDRRHRPKDLNEGDVCLFTDKGERVYLDRDADVVRIGDKAGAEFLILGTKFRSQQSTMNSTLSTQLTAQAAQLGVESGLHATVITAINTAGIGLTAAGADPILASIAPAAVAGLNAAGAALISLLPVIGTLPAAVAAQQAAVTAQQVAVDLFETNGAPDDYQSSKAATVA